MCVASSGGVIQHVQGEPERPWPAALSCQPSHLTPRPLCLQTRMSASSSPSSALGTSPSASTPMAGTAAAATSAAAGALSPMRTARLAWVSDGWDALTPCHRSLAKLVGSSPKAPPWDAVAPLPKAWPHPATCQVAAQPPPPSGSVSVLPAPPAELPLTPPSLFLSLFLSCSFSPSLCSSSGLFWGIPLCRELVRAPPQCPSPSSPRTLPLPLCTLTPARNTPEQPWRKDRPASACLFFSLSFSPCRTTLEAPAVPCWGGLRWDGHGAVSGKADPGQHPFTGTSCPSAAPAMLAPPGRSLAPSPRYCTMCLLVWPATCVLCLPPPR